MELATAATEVVGNGLTELDFLNYFGRCFIRSFDQYGYDKIIKVLPVLPQFFKSFLSSIGSLFYLFIFLYKQS
jgi:hypothetical protein